MLLLLLFTRVGCPLHICPSSLHSFTGPWSKTNIWARYHLISTNINVAVSTSYDPSFFFLLLPMTLFTSLRTTRVSRWNTGVEGRKEVTLVSTKRRGGLHRSNWFFFLPHPFHFIRIAPSLEQHHIKKKSEGAKRARTLVFYVLLCSRSFLAIEPSSYFANLNFLMNTHLLIVCLDSFLPLRSSYSLPKL